jgi:hypothetical protein
MENLQKLYKFSKNCGNFFRVLISNIMRVKISQEGDGEYPKM